MPTTTNVNTLKINVLTKDQFANAEKDPNQLYMIMDEEEISLATVTKSGLMSASDKIKLDNIDSEANKTVIVNNLISDSTTSALSAAMGKSLKDAIDSITTDIGEMGGGDMLKASYDSNKNGVVDDSEKLGGQLPSYYAKHFDVDKTLSLKNGVLSVNTADSAEQDNTLPITSAAVYATIGNIEVLLGTI